MKNNKFGYLALFGAWTIGVATVTSTVNILDRNFILLLFSLLGIVAGIGLILRGKSE